MNLLTIYLDALAACAPDRLVRAVVPRDAPRNVVAIGKCAAGLLDGVASVIRIDRAFAAIPRGYALPSTPAEVAIGGHPDMTAESFDAGRLLLAFVDACDDVLFLISGGGSACVEVPLDGVREADLTAINARLVASGMSIGEINAERRKYSAIKGGKLSQRVRGRFVTLVYSDVSDGRLGDVASGPAENPILIADNHTLVSAAARLSGGRALAEQLEGDVSDVARRLWNEARPGELLVAGGEPTVVVRGDGRGGRCTELAARIALLADGEPFRALFASSDGVDGTSGWAGVHIQRNPRLDRSWADAELARSNSVAVAAAAGEPIMIPPTGNNLRDLYLLARG